eukprot:3436102-Pleurochrysis_carterae.AAC.1
MIIATALATHVAAIQPSHRSATRESPPQPLTETPPAPRDTMPSPPEPPHEPHALHAHAENSTNGEAGDLHQHFRRGLGAYPLRNRAPVALLTVRDIHRPHPDLSTRGTGCAFTVSSPNADPKTRKQALRDER